MPSLQKAKRLRRIWPEETRRFTLRKRSDGKLLGGHNSKLVHMRPFHFRQRRQEHYQMKEMYRQLRKEYPGAKLSLYRSIPDAIEEGDYIT